MDYHNITYLLNHHWQGFLHSIPAILIGLVILLIAYGFARAATLITKKIIQRKFVHPLTQNVIARSAGTVVFLLGVYLIFEMAHLTKAAFAVISGTGVLGIILGIAFRDITENFLASILLSLHHPFNPGDLVEITHFTGYVQSLTMRVTLLKSKEGHLIQIPNSVVYKSHIRNYTSNPNRREEFEVGIGYENNITFAQEIILKTLENQEEVLKSSEPLVLLESLGKSAVTLRVLFWIDSSKYNWLKVKSTVIHHVLCALQENGISIPPENREVFFPEGISIRLEESGKNLTKKLQELQKI